MSAYELAVQQGFKGSLDDWLLSLKGTNGKEGTGDFYSISGGNSNSGEIEKLKKEIEELKNITYSVGYNGNLWTNGKDTGVQLIVPPILDTNGNTYMLNTLALTKIVDSAVVLAVVDTPIIVPIAPDIAISKSAIREISIDVAQPGRLTIGFGSTNLNGGGSFKTIP